MASSAPKNPISVRIGRRLATLRNAAKWSLEDLARETRDRLPKSRLSNYEQGTRRLDIEGATILAEIFKCSVSHILCLDGDQPVLGDEERGLIRDLRALPSDQRTAYVRRIGTLALAYREHVPDEVMEQNGFASPTKRRKSAPSKDKGKP